MEHGDIVRAIENEIEKATNDPKLKRLTAAMIVERASIPTADRDRATKITEAVFKRLFGGYSEEEFEQQLSWRSKQIIRHAETLPVEEREAYLASEIAKFNQEAEAASAHAEAFQHETDRLERN